jgi:uncharacterized membrane protein YqjE
MLAPATIPLLSILALFVLIAIGAWPFGALAAVAVVALLLAIAVTLVRLTARMNGPEPPHPSA